MASTPEPVALVGRGEECRRLDNLLDSARIGESGVIVLSGEAGIGKSALLAYARERAAGMAILSARGVEVEAEMPYATLDELLRPIVGRIGELSSAQARALATALALARPGPTDPFAVGAATLSLLAAAADRAPLLGLVDDFHWADPSSRAALVFAARRLRAEGVVLLFAWRGGAESALPLPKLDVGGLSREACRELVGRATGTDVAVSVADSLSERSGANPLALLQIAERLEPGQLAGTLLLPDPLPSSSVEATFTERLLELDERARRFLLLAAANEGGAMDEIIAAAEATAVGEGGVAAAEASGFVTIADGRLLFQHPLLRAAAQHSASAAERRRAHAALADALGAKGELERRAWHLAAAAIAPDEEVAAALETAGTHAWERGDAAAAAAAFDRSARATPDRERRAARLVTAAQAYQLAGEVDRAATLVDQALRDVGDPLRRSAAVHLRAMLDLWRGRPRAARELLVSEAARIETADAAQAAAMLADATVPSLMAADFDPALATARRAWKLAEGLCGESRQAAAALLAIALHAKGDAAEGATLFDRAREFIDAVAPGSSRYALVRVVAWHALIWREEYERVGRLFDGAIEQARATGAPGPLPLLLALRAELRLRTGRWPAAYADASESLALAEQTNQQTQLPHSLITLARIEAGRGWEEQCRAHCARAKDLSRAHGSDLILLYAGAALGLLELGAGRSEDAIAELEPAIRLGRERGLGHPWSVPAGADLVEAFIRAGRAAEAEELLASFEAEAANVSSASAMAAAARCRGMLAADDELDAHFEEALLLHEQATMPFERARTNLCYGERLRRARHRVEARRPLRFALSALDELGAQRWAERARVELRASGGAARDAKPQVLDDLTAQELQVARVVADGATNREAAAALFLSPKTIDFHLRNIYRKLELRSRSELTRLLAAALVS